MFFASEYTIPVQERSCDTSMAAATTLPVTDYFTRPAPNSCLPRHSEIKDSPNTVRIENVDSGYRWLREGLQTIARLGTMTPDWHDADVAPPNLQAVGLATAVLRKLAEMNLKPTSIDPSTGKGICIFFVATNRTANIECFNSGELLAAEMRKGGEPLIWEVTENTMRDGIARLHEFICE